MSGYKRKIFYFFKKVHEEDRKGSRKIKQNKENFSNEAFKGSDDLTIRKINQLISRGN